MKNLSLLIFFLIIISFNSNAYASDNFDFFKFGGKLGIGYSKFDAVQTDKSLGGRETEMDLSSQAQTVYSVGAIAQLSFSPVYMKIGGEKFISPKFTYQSNNTESVDFDSNKSTIDFLLGFWFSDDSSLYVNYRKDMFSIDETKIRSYIDANQKLTDILTEYSIEGFYLGYSTILQNDAVFSIQVSGPDFIKTYATTTKKTIDIDSNFGFGISFSVEKEKCSPQIRLNSVFSKDQGDKYDYKFIDTYFTGALECSF